MFFGLLRGNELLSMKREEVSMLETMEIQIEYQASTKTRVKGFSFLIPSTYAPTFTKYFGEWSAEGGNRLINFFHQS